MAEPRPPQSGGDPGLAGLEARAGRRTAKSLPLGLPERGGSSLTDKTKRPAEGLFSFPATPRKTTLRAAGGHREERQLVTSRWPATASRGRPHRPGPQGHVAAPRPRRSPTHHAEQRPPAGARVGSARGGASAPWAPEPHTRGHLSEAAVTTAAGGRGHRVQRPLHSAGPPRRLECYSPDDGAGTPTAQETVRPWLIRR